MTRPWTSFRHLMTSLMLLVMVAFALHTGAMAKTGNTFVPGVHAQTASGHDHVADTASPADHSAVKHGHGKAPCKSDCCSSGCMLALLSEPLTIQVVIRPGKGFVLDKSAVLEGRYQNGPRRPPRVLLTV